jgi:hypothetical protein
MNLTLGINQPKLVDAFTYINTTLHKVCFGANSIGTEFTIDEMVTGSLLINHPNLVDMLTYTMPSNNEVLGYIPSSKPIFRLKNWLRGGNSLFLAHIKPFSKLILCFELINQWK